MRDAGKVPVAPSPIAYAKAGDPAAHDDDPFAQPAPGSECAAAPGGVTSQSSDARHLVQVQPYAGDRPAPRSVELWALVRPASPEKSPPRMDWNIYRPDGSLLTSVGGTRVAQADCADLGGTGERGSMLEAAVATGQISPALGGGPPASTTSPTPTASPEPIARRCAEGTAFLYHGSFGLSHREACGEYRFEAVVAGDAKSVTRAATFDDLCFTAFEMDFDRIEWGTIAANQQTRVQGDLAWAPPSDSRPTIRNAGNAPAGVGVVFEQMKTGAAAAPGTSPTLDVFEVCLGRLNEPVHCTGDLPAGREGQPGKDVGVLLCPGELGRLDLLVRTPERGNEGRYTGQLRLIAHQADAAAAKC